MPFNLCGFLVAKYNERTQESLYFLQQSQCGYYQFTTYVCCPQTQNSNQARTQQSQVQSQQNQGQYQSQGQYQGQQNQAQYQGQNQQNQIQTQQMTRKLETPKLLPKAPECGVSLDDRIIGGTSTSVTEFPWFALLKYIKREQINLLTSPIIKFHG